MKSLILIFVALSVAPVAAEQYTVDGRILTCKPAEGEPIELELSAPGTAVLAHGDRVFVAGGSRGALVVDVSDPASPKEVGGREMGGSVTGFFILEGAVWARVQRLEARPLDDGSIARAAATEALARLGSSPITSSRKPPPRAGGIWELELSARPFLALGLLGFGTISDACVRRRFEDPWSIEARLEPASIGFADEGNIAALAGNLIGSYDNRLFSVGLGIGWASINGALSDSTEEVRSGLSIAQAARLGARDGLHLSVYNTFLYYNERFNYGGTTGTLQLSVAEGLWFIARGGGGEPTGYGFGEIGLRVLLVGSGDRGSLYLSPSVGGGGLFREERCERFDGCTKALSYGGPLVGLGVEWRK